MDLHIVFFFCLCGCDKPELWLPFTTLWCWTHVLESNYAMSEPFIAAAKLVCMQTSEPNVGGTSCNYGIIIFVIFSFSSSLSLYHHHHHHHHHVPQEKDSRCLELQTFPKPNHFNHNLTHCRLYIQPPAVTEKKPIWKEIPSGSLFKGSSSISFAASSKVDLGPCYLRETGL